MFNILKKREASKAERRQTLLANARRILEKDKLMLAEVERGPSLPPGGAGKGVWH